jgi:N-acetylmuramoyl-L-alanine amidase
MARKHRWTKGGRPRNKARVIELFLILMACFGMTPATAATVSGIAITAQHIRIDFSAPVGEARRFALDGPQRLALDIAGARPAGVVHGTGGPVTRVRQGALGEGGLRLVFDLGQPASVSDARFSADGRSLTLMLRPGTLADFVAFVRAGSRLIRSPLPGMPSLAMAERPQRRYQVTVPIGQLRNGVELPRVMGPNDRALPLIVIDAGHGGHDPGALSPGGQREKDLTLALARAARDALAATGRVRVALTRDTDRFLVLEERYGIARRLGADLFISIHCDAAANSEATGATIYTLSDVASDREAARLAARENRANMLGGIDLGGQSSDVRSILIDLTQRETMNRSVDFARTLQQVGGPHIPFRRGAHRFAGFVVLKAPDMPSILLEAGFMTNGGDVARLASATGQQALARGVTNGVLTHFARESAVRQTPIGSAGPADAAR